MGFEGFDRSALEKAVRAFAKDNKSEGPVPSPKALRAALTAGAILGGSVNTADAKTTPSIERAMQADILSEKEVDILSRNIFHEARGETTPGQLAVAQVTIARLLSAKFGASLQDVVFAKNQFSWTRQPEPERSARDESALENIRAVLSLYVGGKPLAHAVQQLAKETGLPLDALYYKRSDLKENDPDETRMSKQSKDFFRSLSHVGDVGKHSFYALRTKVSAK